MDRVCIVVPAFNDWESAKQLLIQLGTVGRENAIRYRVIVVDDGSTLPLPDALVDVRYPFVDSLKIVRLACNLGHQRAIAVGLVVSREEIDSCSSVIVMDVDGEDLPSDVPNLIAASARHPDSVICARRARRSEPFVFRAFYVLYKFVFVKLTGIEIDFGNFCLIPKSALRTVASQAGIWNHLAATLTRSRVPLLKIDTVRGHRYAGQSTMNFVSLVLHGLSAIAVYADVVLVRLVLMAVFIAGCAIAGMVATVALRFMTNLAIPGWASGVVGTLSIILFQAILIPAIGVFVILSSRTARTVVPLVDAKDFVESVRSAHVRSTAA